MANNIYNLTRKVFLGLLIAILIWYVITCAIGLIGINKKSKKKVKGQAMALFATTMVIGMLTSLFGILAAYKVKKL